MFRRRDDDEFENFEGVTNPNPTAANASSGSSNYSSNYGSTSTAASSSSTGGSQLFGQDSLYNKPAASTASSATKSPALSDTTPSKASKPASAASYQISGAGSSVTPKETEEQTSGLVGVEAERRLTVGYGITLEGKVSNCDKLIIYGSVNAELNDVKSLHISESGKFMGSAQIENAEIAGEFEGDLFVKDSITVNSTGRVNGKITYGSIEIKPGGKFTGQIIEKDTEAVAAEAETTSKTAKKKSQSKQSGSKTSKAQQFDLTSAAQELKTEAEEVA